MARERQSGVPELAAHGGDVADPWYSRDFARAYQDIATGCRALLTALTTE